MLELIIAKLVMKSPPMYAEARKSVQVWFNILYNLSTG